MQVLGTARLSSSKESAQSANLDLFSSTIFAYKDVLMEPFPTLLTVQIQLNCS